MNIKAFSQILVISQNTFKETIRNRILYNILIFSILMITFSYLLRTLTILQDEKIVIDLSLSCISIFGVIIAIFIGVGLVYSELEKRTIYTILSKPVSRRVFILGKYFGLLITLFVNVTIMTAVMYLILAFTERGADYIIMKAVLLIYVELMIITAIAIFFSSFSTPTFSAIFTISFYVIGYLTDDLKNLGQLSGNALLKNVTGFIYYVFPNLNYFNIRSEIVHNIPITSEQIILSIVYGTIFIFIFLMISILIFNKKDFK